MKSFQPETLEWGIAWGGAVIFVGITYPDQTCQAIIPEESWGIIAALQEALSILWGTLATLDLGTLILTTQRNSCTNHARLLLQERVILAATVRRY